MICWYADMLISLYGLSRKSKKWWHRILFGLINRALCNALIALNKITKAKMKSLDFCRRVAQSLITRLVGVVLRTTIIICTTQLHQKRESRWHIPFLSQFGKKIWGFTGPIMVKNVIVRYVQRTSKRLAPTSNIVHAMCSFVWMREKLFYKVSWLVNGRWLWPFM